MNAMIFLSLLGATSVTKTFLMNCLGGKTIPLLWSMTPVQRPISQTQ